MFIMLSTIPFPRPQFPPVCVEMRPANLLLCRMLLCVVEKQQPCNALLRPSQDNRPRFGLGRSALALFRLWALRLGLGLFLRVSVIFR